MNEQDYDELWYKVVRVVRVNGTVKYISKMLTPRDCIDWRSAARGPCVTPSLYAAEYRIGETLVNHKAPYFLYETESEALGDDHLLDRQREYAVLMCGCDLTFRPIGDEVYFLDVVGQHMWDRTFDKFWEHRLIEPCSEPVESVHPMFQKLLARNMVLAGEVTPLKRIA